MFGSGTNPFSLNSNTTNNNLNMFAKPGQSKSLFPVNAPLTQTNPLNPLPNLGVSQNKQQKGKLNIFGVHQQKKKEEQNTMIKKKQQQSLKQQNPSNLFAPSLTPQTQINFGMNPKTNLTEKQEPASNKIFGDANPPYFNFNSNNKSELNKQTIERQASEVEKKLFAGLANKNAQSSVLNAVTVKKEVIAQEATKSPAKEPMENNFFNRETIKNVVKQSNPNPQKNQIIIAPSRRKEQEKQYGLTSKQLQDLTKQIEQDILRREGQNQYVQAIRESLIEERNENKEKIISKLRKEKNNIILNNNNTLQIQRVASRVQQQQIENKKMKEEKQFIVKQIEKLDNQIEKQKEKEQGLNQQIERPDFPLIKPSVSVKQVLQKICKFLPSNKIRDQGIKLKQKIQRKARLEEQIKQFQLAQQELEKELKKKEVEKIASQNQIINILEDEQQLKDYLNNHLKPRRIALEEKYQELKKKVKEMRKNKPNLYKSRVFQALSQIY